MSPQISSSGFMKHHRTGSVQIPHHILTTRMESWGSFKSSVSNLSVHMELSFRLSFYLRYNLGGYTVGTNVGFPVKIMEVLAP
jgi:hypothetical protein